MPCFASCCLCIARGWLCLPLLVFLLWIEPGDEYMIEEPVEYAYEDQAFDNSENLAGKMATPRDHFYLCYASCSLYCHAPLPITCYIMPPILPCQASNPPFLANRCFAMLPLCSAPHIALLVAGEDWSLFLVGTCFFVGISQYLLFN